MKNTIKLIVQNDKINQRLDTYISHNKKELSRSQVKRLILNKKLTINEKIVINPSKKVKIGDEIVLQIIETPKAFIKPYKYKLDIVYEDNDLIIINKKAGISMHPGAGNYDNTLVNALINYNNGNLSNIGDELRPGIVHRIDKDTSGLVVIAKNNLAHENLSDQFKKHSIVRVYHALVWGKIRPQNGHIQTLIKRSTRNRQLMEVVLTKGKHASTKYKTLEIFENQFTPTLSLVECKLETGRTHQIRVHMSHKGNYIVGDKKYKKKYKKFKNIDKSIESSLISLQRQFLHAGTLGFKHPANDKNLVFKSKFPPELENILKKLRKSAK